MPDSSAPGPEETPSPLEPGSAGGAPLTRSASTDLEVGEPPASEPRKRPTRNLVVAGAAAGVLVLGGAGAYAFTALSGGGAQPHDVLPSTVLAYGRVDLDPSAGQKVEIFRLLQKLPELKDSIGDENADLRAVLVENAFGEDCAVDFASDVEPWLGQRAGVALLSEPLEPVFAIQVDDEEKARTGVTQLAECAGEDEVAVAFLDGYAIVGSEQATVDAAVEAASAKSLADTAEFSDSMEDIGDQGVASGWMDYGAVMAHPQISELIAQSAAQTGQVVPDMSEQASELGAMTFALRADSSAIELRGAVEGAAAINGDARIDTGQIPDSTVLAFGTAFPETDGVDYTERLMAGLTASGLDDQTTAEFEQVMGVSFEEFLTLSVADPVLTVGERGLADLGGLTGPESIGTIDVALRSHGDEAELRDIGQRLGAAARTFGVELVVEDVEGGVALATSPGALEVGSGITASETYRSVVPFESVMSLAYLDFDKLQPVIELMAEGDEEVLANVAPLRALGVSTTADEFSLRLSFDD